LVESRPGLVVDLSNLKRLGLPIPVTKNLSVMLGGEVTITFFKVFKKFVRTLLTSIKTFSVTFSSGKEGLKQG
jgi:hypothetical protein